MFINFLYAYKFLYEWWCLLWSKWFVYFKFFILFFIFYFYCWAMSVESINIFCWVMKYFFVCDEIFSGECSEQTVARWLELWLWFNIYIYIYIGGVVWSNIYECGVVNIFFYFLFFYFLFFIFYFLFFYFLLAIEIFFVWCSI